MCLRWRLLTKTEVTPVEAEGAKPESCTFPHTLSKKSKQCTVVPQVVVFCADMHIHERVRVKFSFGCLASKSKKL